MTRKTLLPVLLTLLVSQGGLSAELHWRWTFAGEAGFFVTDGTDANRTLATRLAPVSFKIRDFYVTESFFGTGLGSTFNDQYSTSMRGAMLFGDGSSVTGFLDNRLNPYLDVFGQLQNPNFRFVAEGQSATRGGTGWTLSVDPVPRQKFYLLDATAGRTLTSASEVGRYFFNRKTQNQTVTKVTRRRSAVGFLAVHSDGPIPVDATVSLGLEGRSNARLKILMLKDGRWERSSLTDFRLRTLRPKSSVVFRVHISSAQKRKEGWAEVGIFSRVGSINTITDRARFVAELGRRDVDDSIPEPPFANRASSL